MPFLWKELLIYFAVLRTEFGQEKKRKEKKLSFAPKSLFQGKKKIVFFFQTGKSQYCNNRKIP